MLQQNEFTTPRKNQQDQRKTETDTQTNNNKKNNNRTSHWTLYKKETNTHLTKSQRVYQEIKWNRMATLYTQKKIKINTDTNERDNKQ